MKNKNFKKLFLTLMLCTFVLFGGMFFGLSLNSNVNCDVFADGIYSVTVNVDDTEGEIVVAAVNASGEKIDFESGTFYDQGTMITINAFANQGFEFAYYTVNELTKVYDVCSSFIINDTTTIDVVFTVKKYQLDISVRDSVLNQIAGGEVNAQITYQNNDLINNPNQMFIRVGDTIKSIQANNVQMNKYNYLGTFIEDKNGAKVPLQFGVTGLTVDQDFIDSYCVDNKITIYVQYVQLCKLKIIVPEECKSNSNFMLLMKSGENSFEEVNQLSASYTYGTCFSIMAKNQKYYDFKTFNGANDDEQYVLGSAFLNFVMTGDRTISLVYQPKTFKLVLYTSNVDAGTVKLSGESLKLGDTLVFNYELGATRKLQSILVNDDSIDEFVDMLNSVSTAENDVAVKTGEGLFSVYVDKDIFDYFNVHNTLIVKTKTEANVGFILLIVLYVVLLVISGAGFVIFGILYNKTNKKVSETNKVQADAVKQKQEAFIREKAISDQAVSLEYEYLKKQKEDLDKNKQRIKKIDEIQNADDHSNQSVKKAKVKASDASAKKKSSVFETGLNSKTAVKKTNKGAVQGETDTIKKKSVSKKKTSTEKAVKKQAEKTSENKKRTAVTMQADENKKAIKKTSSKTKAETAVKHAKMSAVEEGKK